MNKRILIGVGALAVLGIGGYFWWSSRKKAETTSESGALKSAQAGSSTSELGEEGYSEDIVGDSLSAPASKQEARQQRRQKRRDCRAEAKAKGLKGKAKRQFKRECKAGGGISDEFVSDEADFAFNGYSSFD